MSKFSEWRVGASTACFGSWSPELLKEYADAGIASMELSTGLDGFFAELRFIDQAEKIGEITRGAGVELRSIHLPFSQKLDVSREDDWAAQTVDINLALIDAAHRAKVPLIVIHPSSEPIDDKDREKRLEISKKNLSYLGRRTAEYGMKLCVEDLPRTCLGRTSDDINYLIADDPNLWCVFDTNHLLMQDNAEFVRKVGSKIIALHVSDYDFIDERHVIPLDGKNDWKGIIKALEDVGYSGDWTYELKREWTPKEVAENKRKLGEIA